MTIAKTVHILHSAGHFVIMRYNYRMKFFLGLIILLLRLEGEELESYLSVGIVSHHFSTDERGNAFNDDHHAYGAEIDWEKRYMVAYLHLLNSREKATDIYALGYRYDLYAPFGVAGVVGYQRGYCFDGLKSVECTEGNHNSGLAFIPMLYYRHDYFTLDLVTEGRMIALKLNIRLF